jgi:hypothetical protein
MVRMVWKLCPEAHSRSITSRRVNSTSQSGSGAVMMTSQTSSAGGGILLLQLANQFPGVGLGPGHAGTVAARPEPRPFSPACHLRAIPSATPPVPHGQLQTLTVL